MEVRVGVSRYVVQDLFSLDVDMYLPYITTKAHVGSYEGLILRALVSKELASGLPGYLKNI
jgi:hypothetical protein